MSRWLANPENRTQVWNYPATDRWNPKRGWGLPAAISFAIARGKPFGLSETVFAHKDGTRLGNYALREIEVYP